MLFIISFSRSQESLVTHWERFLPEIKNMELSPANWSSFLQIRLVSNQWMFRLIIILFVFFLCNISSDIYQLLIKLWYYWSFLQQREKWKSCKNTILNMKIWNNLPWSCHAAVKDLLSNPGCISNLIFLFDRWTN